MNLWWLQPGWTDARCSCGKKIWPEGDPDWGACYECFTAQTSRNQDRQPMYPCDICGKNEAVAGSNGYGVCSEGCSIDAERKEPKK